MRILALLALLAVGARAQQSGPPEVLQLPKQNGGAATFYSGNRINPAQSPYILNGYLDADAAVVKRNGYQVYGTVAGCTQALTGGWSYTNLNGTNYFFVQCGSQMYETKGDGAFNTIGSTLSVVYPVRATSALGYEWFADGADQLWYTDGVTVSSVATAPYAQLIGTFQNRLVLSNIAGGPGGSGFVAAQSGSWISGYQSGTDFSLPSVIVDTSAAFFPLNGSNDTRQVTCAFDGFKNVEILWNNGQMWGLYGSGNSTFVLQLISNEIGCTDQGSVQEYNGHLYWLSKRGIESFDGTSVNLASWPIQDQVQNLIALQKQAAQNIQTSQGDWQAGNLTAAGPGAPLSATISVGDVVPSSWSVSDVAFAGTASSAAVVNGVLQISSGSPFINAGFNSTTANTNWTFTGFSTTTGNCFSGNASARTLKDATNIGTGSPLNATVEVYNAANAQLLYSKTVDAFSVTQCPLLSGTPITVNLSTLSATSLYVKAFSAKTPSLYTMTSANFPNWLDGFQYGWEDDCRIGGDNACALIFNINELSGGVAFASATFVSQTFDTSFSTPTWGLFSSTFTQAVNGSTVTFQVQVATSASGVWDALLGATDTVKFANAQKEYLRYKVTVNQSSSTQVATVSGVGLAAETTGYLITQCIQPTGITAWGAIQSNNLPNGGSFTYWMSTGTTCAAAINPLNTNWTQQTLNTTITVATAAAVAVRVLENVDVATEVPKLQDITLNWTVGSGRPALTSTIYNKRYYLAYTTNTASSAANDHVLVYDTNNTWALLDDIFASGIFTSALKLYTASSQSDGKVFLQDSGNVDNGNAFQFRVDTPDLDLGNFAAVKDLDDWWLEAQGTTLQPSASNVSVNYFVDGGTTAYSAGTFSTYSPERGYIFPNGSFGLGGSPTKAHTLRLQYLDTSASPLRIYQTNLRYWTESLP